MTVLLFITVPPQLPCLTFTDFISLQHIPIRHITFYLETCCYGYGCYGYDVVLSWHLRNTKAGMVHYLPPRRGLAPSTFTHPDYCDQTEQDVSDTQCHF